MNDFNDFGYPVLLGTSRKSMIGLTLDLPVDQRVEGTITTSVWAVQAHYGFVRVHDVAANYRAVRMPGKCQVKYSDECTIEIRNKQMFFKG